MSKATLYEKTGKAGGEIELNDAVFGSRVNRHLLDFVVVRLGGNLRRGTHSTKTRGEVRGGGKKPWRQKGTGRARHGSRRSPIWRGGGTVFGPHPRSYYTRLSSGMKRSALISALSLKNKENNIVFLKDAALKEAKTKELFSILKMLKLVDTPTLFVVKSVDEKLKRASQNLHDTFSVKLASDVNAYHIVRRSKVLIEKNALATIERRALAVPEEAAPCNSSETEARP